MADRKKLTDRHWKPWVKGFFHIKGFRCLALVFCISLTGRTNAQQRGQPAMGSSLDGKSAQGSLTVTATVVSSVGVLIGPHGEQILVVANAPAGDNKSVLTPVGAPPPDPTQPTNEQHEKAPK